MSAAPFIVPEMPDYRQPPLLRLENFLSQADHDALFAFAAHDPERYVGSTTTNKKAEARRSRVLYEIAPEIVQPLVDALTAASPYAALSLGLACPARFGFEVQITAHGDGEYYHRHSDDCSADTATRLMTYVYYLGATPTRFEGGALRVYRTRRILGVSEGSDDFVDYAPIPNSVVFFPSYAVHEVMPVRSASADFADARFTANGWLRPIDAPAEGDFDGWSGLSRRA